VVEVVEQLSKELNPQQKPDIGPATHLEWDLGLGSIERHELLQRLEKQLGESLSSRAVFEASTVSDLIKLTPGAERLSRETVNFEPGQIPPHPAHVDNLVDALLYQAEHQSGKKTLHFLEEGETVREWTYADLVEAAKKVAGGLNSAGVKPGDRVGLMLPTSPDYVAAFFGIQWVGAIPVPLYPPFRLDQLEDYVKRQSAILKIAGVKCLISFEQAKPIVPLLKLNCPDLERVVTVPDLSGPPPHPRTQERGLIQFTSGSTGVPKGVVLTHKSLIHNIQGYGHVLNLRQDDVVITWLPLYHDMGLIGTLLGSIYHGQPLALMGPQDFLARPSRWLWMLHRYRGTITAAPNFAYEICARKIPDEELEGLDLSPWRIALNGAEAVRPETLERFTKKYEAYGFRDQAHFPAYGLAEASLAVTFPPPGRGPVLDTVSRKMLEADNLVAACGPDEPSLTLVACGRPLPDMEVRILDKDGNLLEDGHRGLVEFRGPSSLQCYFDNPEATEKTKSPEGWVRTGDLGYLSEGDLYLTGRVKDVIIKAGRNIQAEDVEDAVAGVEGVRRGCIAAFGVEDESEGTELLVIVAESRQKGSEARRNLASAVEKQVSQILGIPPDRVEIVPPHTVPKTPSGKIRRSETKKRWMENDLQPSGSMVGQIGKVITRGAGVYGKKLAGLPKIWARKGWCYGWLVSLLFTPPAISLINKRWARRSLHPMANFYLKRVGVHLDVRGEASYPGPCILVSNHCSTLDPLALAAVWKSPLTYLVAPWVSEHPLLKQLISRLGHIPVHRGDPDRAAAQEAELEERLRQGESLAIFPEGGVEVTAGLRPFALGAFRLAARLDVPVIPIALTGTRQAQPVPEMIPNPTPIMAVVGPPMEADDTDWDSILKLSNQARAWIAEECGDPLSHKRLRRYD